MLFVLKLFTGAGSLASQLNVASTAAVAIALLKKFHVELGLLVVPPFSMLISFIQRIKSVADSVFNFLNLSTLNY
jgi:hypothetical protein